MLTKLRPVARRLLEAPARLLVRAGLSADQVTLLGLLGSLLPIYFAYRGESLLVAFFIGFSGLLDALDGSVARLTGTASRAGAFLDSTTDRLADAFYYVSLIVLGLNPVLASLAMGFALVTSYSKARSASLGLVEEEGIGLMERGDRILALILVATLYSYEPRWGDYALAVLAVLSLYTVLERSIYYYRFLKSGD